MDASSEKMFKIEKKKLMLMFSIFTVFRFPKVRPTTSFNEGWITIER